MRICYINSVCGFGSTGRIVEDLANMEGVESLIIYGRHKTNNSKAHKMTNRFGIFIAATKTILFNKNGLSNKSETLKTIQKIKEFNPDIIHLHNLHGYYINYEILFKFLKDYNKPVIWTLHDCWSFTGYCTHFDYVGCNKYKTGCNRRCPCKFYYPFSLFKQGITEQYKLKKDLFTVLDNLTIVTPSIWLMEKAKEGYFKNMNIEAINNGINTSAFKPSLPKNNEFTILFVSNIWTKQKGVEDIEKLLPMIDKDIKIIIVGKIRATKQIKNRCLLIKRTNNKEELRDLYSQSHLFINPTLEETYGLVNVEAQACGTPVITYDTGGSKETILEGNGVLIEKGDVKGLADAINAIKKEYNYKVSDITKNISTTDNSYMREKYYKLYTKQK